MNYTSDYIIERYRLEGVGVCVHPYECDSPDIDEQKAWAIGHCQGEWFCSHIYSIATGMLWLFEHEADRLLFALRWSDRGK